jgi:hypothetical protein
LIGIASDASAASTWRERYRNLPDLHRFRNLPDLATLFGQS